MKSMFNSFKSFAVLLTIIVHAIVGAACVPEPSAVSSGPSAVKEKSSSVGSAALAQKQLWQERWEKVLVDAKKEGKVTVYTGSVAPSVRQALASAFKDRFGVALEFIPGRGTEIAQKLIFERHSGVYIADIVILGPDSSLTLKENQTFVSPVSSLILPEVLDAKAWPGGDLPFFDRDRLLFPLTLGYQSYTIFNTEFVRENEIKSYLDFLDPKLKGKIVLSDPKVGGGSGINWVTFILQHAFGPEEGKKYLQQIARQDILITRDNRLQVEWTARGKYTIAIGPTVSLVSEFIKDGAPLKWARLREGGSLAPTASLVGKIDNPAHPNAAAILINWLLTEEGQTLFSKSFGQPAVRLGISSEGIDPGRIPQPGEKTYLADEDFTISSKETSIKIAREIFKD